MESRLRGVWLLFRARCWLEAELSRFVYFFFSVAEATSFLKTAVEGLGSPKNCVWKALKKELAMSVLAAVCASRLLSMRCRFCSAAMYFCSREMAPWGPLLRAARDWR